MFGFVPICPKQFKNNTNKPKVVVLSIHLIPIDFRDRNCVLQFCISFPPVGRLCSSLESSEWSLGGLVQLLTARFEKPDLSLPFSHLELKGYHGYYNQRIITWVHVHIDIETQQDCSSTVHWCTVSLFNRFHHMFHHDDLLTHPESYRRTSIYIYTYRYMYTIH